MALRKIKTFLFNKNIIQPIVLRCENLHISSILTQKKDEKKCKWLTHNEKIYEPQGVDEEPRPAVRIFILLFIKHNRNIFSLFAISD